jgi:large subunit ribosomal protein L18
MAKVNLRKNKLRRRKMRVRKKIFGTKEKPRLAVFRSNRYCYAQLIDDEKGETLAGLSLKDIKKAHEKEGKKKGAFKVGRLLAEKAKKKKIKKAVFDRAGYQYHGRVKQVAEGAREGGLEL